jgi:hypothetical protein
MIASKGRIIHDDLGWGDEGEYMEFRLTFAGTLLASNTGRDEEPARKHYKRWLRKQFHPQLRRLWTETPHLRVGRGIGQGVLWDNTIKEDHLYIYDIESLAKKHAHYGFNFVPLVTGDLNLSCWLDILFLRPKKSGDVSGDVLQDKGQDRGDIDNRVKTIFDCLAIPDANQGYSDCKPQEDEKPFFCLLENDKMVSKISIETDRLLEEVSLDNRYTRENGEILSSDYDARLIIAVRLRPQEMNFLNLQFG